MDLHLDRTMPAEDIQNWLRKTLPDVIADIADQTSPKAPLEHWRLLSALGRTDLVLARLTEGHLDAQAIMAETGRPTVSDALYGVWASASGGTGLTLTSRTDDRRQTNIGAAPPTDTEVLRDRALVSLSGTMRFCSGALLLDRALTTARDSSGQLYLFDIDVRSDRLRADPDSWPALGMDASLSLDVVVDDLHVDASDVVGPPGFYVERSGLPLGGMGVAAVWLGGLQGLVDATCRVLGDRAPDEHGLAHLGAVVVAVESAAATLLAAAERLAQAPANPVTQLCDLPLNELSRIALICRSSVEAAATIAIHRLPRVVGPVGLSRDGDFAHRLADLEVFVRQHHGERDLAVLGALELADPWSLDRSVHPTDTAQSASSAVR